MLEDQTSRDRYNTWNLNQDSFTFVASKEKQTVLEGTHGVTPSRTGNLLVVDRLDVFECSVHAF